MALFLSAACSREPAPPPQNAAENAVSPTPVGSAEDASIDTILDRETLLITMMEAASATALGESDTEAQRTLNGRRIAVRMRFGCGQGIESSSRSWAHDTVAGSLKVSVKPDVTVEDEDGGSSSGFLIAQPLLLQAGCTSGDVAKALAPEGLQFGIVQPLSEDEPRSRRLLDTYEIVKKIDPAAVPTQGLDLIVRGRLDNAGAGKAISCGIVDGGLRCLARATIDQVSIEDPASGQLIAEWASR